ncbi:hypothetical protein [Rhizobium lentis]|uniref:Uncharacterized protein n=1 Tax=Rhizobium lentis TaxID=1138194 RepID=A0A7W8XKB3_9HYPH|nr:hypothetical protein [Rhizobium lentis]MBB4577225.1 hypothetical protein [Rhizobium lentis]MBB5553788.1 hypothetical protein [Rhizobium lentis]MBB5564349.1 hypothetical protein [Rhizobium lentis]MBB5570851.1 hypothetical protein [Rhizobium lentis]
MLADDDAGQVQTGGLSPGLHKPKAWLIQLIEFVCEQLPAWRDRPTRPQADGETVLTSQLCAHLNSVARKSAGWDILQFRVEEPDEVNRGRRVDLAAAPAGEVIWVGGRRYEDFDPLLPIECKRLPTPAGRDRDKREYLRVAAGSTGGVQRFKSGHHGAIHDRAILIAYVQTNDITHWVKKIDRWIRAFSRASIAGWSLQDRLDLSRHDRVHRAAVLSSTHARERGLGDICVHHLWVEI